MKNTALVLFMGLLASAMPVQKRDDVVVVSTTTKVVHGTKYVYRKKSTVQTAETAAAETAAATTTPATSTSASATAAGTSTSTTSTSATSSASASASASSSGYYKYTKDGLKGVNLGGWLVMEPWINTDLFSKTNFPDGDIPADEFNFCESLGTDAAGELLEAHYASWITEDDFKKISSYGLNAVRIPIGYWAWKLMSTDKYYKGTQADYLDKAIGWARDNGIYVVIDLHGAPGSQNGYDSSGHKNFHDWTGYNNLNETKEILNTIIKKYGAESYADVVVGIELVNEPLIGGDGTTQSVLSQFYSEVLDESDTSQNMVLHDGYLSQGSWKDESYISDANVIVDTHLYMLYDSGYKALSFDGKIKQACEWGSDIGALSYPEIVGEFTAAWDSDSSSVYTEKISKWGDDDKKKLRMFVEAQLTAFESSYGWFFWNWKMGDSDQWDFQVLVENDIIPQPLSDRKYDTC